MDVEYYAEPTLSRLHHSEAHVRGIMGPIGSGKSVGCCMEILDKARTQAPDKNGMRKSRWAIIRQTYPELKSTTIQTWQDWVPNQICPITYGAPIEGRFITSLPDGTTVDLHLYFLALARPKDRHRLLSMELTGVWVNEARELDKQVIMDAYSRTGRYPKMIRDDPSAVGWWGMIMDTNPPDNDSWWHELAEKAKPTGWEFFRQPPGIVPVFDANGNVCSYRANPKAENVKNLKLGHQYWMRMTEGADREWINVHCCGNYGSVFEGRPVYNDVFNETVHVANQPLGLYRGLPIHLGWDFGLTPACVVGQVAPNGQLRILREYVCTRGGIKQFATDVVKPALANTFPNIPFVSTGDPAGDQASQADELTCIGQLGMLGIPTKPASTNVFLPRRQAVMDHLTRNLGDKPAMLIDPSCSMVIGGFRGGYMFNRVQVVGEQRFKDEPSKNKYSHPADAVQYLVLGVDTVQSVAVRPEPPPPPMPSWG